MNFDALDELSKRHPDLDIVFLESGGDNLAASFSPELVDASMYVIDVSGGDKIPCKGGPGVTRSDLLVINKTRVVAGITTLLIGGTVIVTHTAIAAPDAATDPQIDPQGRTFLAELNKSRPRGSARLRD
jgi:hypothetical protein